MEALSLTRDDKTLRWTEKTFGDPPPGGHSLWISMHGGGNAPPRSTIVNGRTRAGCMSRPRGSTWRRALRRTRGISGTKATSIRCSSILIETYVAVRGVNPNRFYLMGYSAGGDGVWQLAPRMADRFAAAAMMAGHPNEASLLGLRNLPFAIFMGGDDRAYNRNQVAAERATELDASRKEDPGGYVHMSRIYEGTGHWMNGKDAEALPWMAQFERNPWPRKSSGSRTTWCIDGSTGCAFPTARRSRIGNSCAPP
jgi:predicted esterase